MFPRFNWLIEPNLSNFRVFFREYAHKIALTSSFSQPKMHQISLGGRAPPGPAGGAYSAPPDLLAEFKGPTSKGRGGAGRKGRGREGRGGREGVGEEGKGRGKGGEGPISLSPPWHEILRTPLVSSTKSFSNLYSLILNYWEFSTESVISLYCTEFGCSYCAARLGLLVAAALTTCPKSTCIIDVAEETKSTATTINCADSNDRWEIHWRIDCKSYALSRKSQTAVLSK